jgi:hypothetical protein
MAFVSLIIITTIQLTLNYNSMKISDRIKLLVQVSIESVIQLIAIIITFYMSTIKPLPSSLGMDMEKLSLKNSAIKEDDNGLDI